MPAWKLSKCCRSFLLKAEIKRIPSGQNGKMTPMVMVSAMYLAFSGTCNPFSEGFFLVMRKIKLQPAVHHFKWKWAILDVVLHR
jgi:hypothetical protein